MKYQPNKKVTTTIWKPTKACQWVSLHLLLSTLCQPCKEFSIEYRNYCNVLSGCRSSILVNRLVDDVWCFKVRVFLLMQMLGSKIAATILQRGPYLWGKGAQSLVLGRSSYQLLGSGDCLCVGSVVCIKSVGWEYQIYNQTLFDIIYSIYSSRRYVQLLATALLGCSYLLPLSLLVTD